MSETDFLSVVCHEGACGWIARVGSERWWNDARLDGRTQAERHQSGLWQRDRNTPDLRWGTSTATSVDSVSQSLCVCEWSGGEFPCHFHFPSRSASVGYLCWHWLLCNRHTDNDIGKWWKRATTLFCAHFFVRMYDMWLYLVRCLTLHAVYQYG